MPTKLNAEGVVKPLDFANALKTAMRHGFDAATSGETFVDAWTGFTGDENPAIDRIQQALAALTNSKPAVGDDGLIERLREDAEYLDNYDGFIGSPDHIVRNINEAASAHAAAHSQHEADVAMIGELTEALKTDGLPAVELLIESERLGDDDECNPVGGADLCGCEACDEIGCLIDKRRRLSALAGVKP